MSADAKCESVAAHGPGPPPVPRHPLGANGNGFVVIPKWFVSFLSLLWSVVFLGAVTWAWSISADVSAIKAEVRAQSELWQMELEDVRRRLDRHDALFDRFFHQQLHQRGQ